MPTTRLQDTEVDGCSARPNLPPLSRTFPVEQYPLREVTGTGFTAQSVRGPEADACSSTASEMLVEWRGNMLSGVSSEGDASLYSEADPFVVSDLPPHQGAAQDGILIIRNEALFPGMVGIIVRKKNDDSGSNTLWVREDGTFNLSGFFRRQIPKFEIAAVVAAATNMAEFLDVYHAMYRPAVEAAAARQQFKVMRTVIEAGMKYYSEEDSPQRLELLELRRRVVALRAHATQAANSRSSNGKETQTGMPRVSSLEQIRNNQGWMSTEEAMQMRRRLSDSKRSNSRPTSPGIEKPAASAGMESGASAQDDNDLDEAGNIRSARTSSGNARSSKIAEQVVTGAAPQQKSPFRLWKSDIGRESYDKSRPS